MALDNVRKDIIESAKAKAAEQSQAAQKEASVILAEADSMISEMRKKEGKKLEEAIEHLRRQELSSAELESKKIVLSKQKDILNRAFVESLAGLEKSKPDTKKRYYAQMVELTKDLIEDPKVYCPMGEKARLKDVKAYSVTEDEDISGGLILETQDGSVRVDMQFSTILRSAWEKELKGLSDILFG